MDKGYSYDEPQQQMAEPQEPIIIELNNPNNYWFESGTAIVVALISAFVALRLRGHK